MRDKELNKQLIKVVRRIVASYEGEPPNIIFEALFQTLASYIAIYDQEVRLILVKKVLSNLDDVVGGFAVEVEQKTKDVTGPSLH